MTIFAVFVAARAGMAVLVAATVLAVAPSTAAAQQGLSDVPDTGAHSAAIGTLYNDGVFDGTLCGDGLFCGDAPLTRADLAVWMVRVLDGTDPPAVTSTRFSDVTGGDPRAKFIERFAQLGVTVGCDTSPLRYCGNDPVTRAQMATFLVRAFNLPAAARSAGFTDVAAGGTHSARIDALAASGVTVGCATSPLRYCPTEPVTRAQMATFLVRAGDDGGGATAAVLAAAHDRISASRTAAGLTPVAVGDPDDSAYIPIFEWVIGCYETADDHEDLRRPDIHAVGLVAVYNPSECAMAVTTYHYVPDSEKLRVEQAVWDCFKESRDIADPDSTSCAGRYTAIIGHVKWLPHNALYRIASGGAHRDELPAVVAWVEDNLHVHLTEATAAQTPDLVLYLDGPVPAGCHGALGCNRYTDNGERRSAVVYIAQDTGSGFFAQVLKHELLHALVPMGHLPPGEHLMAAQTDNPTRGLSELERKLLALYTHPYLTDGMEIDRFRNYLIVE